MEDSLMSRTFEEQHLFEIEIVICNIIHLILLSPYTVYFQVTPVASDCEKTSNWHQNLCKKTKQVKYVNQTDINHLMWHDLMLIKSNILPTYTLNHFHVWDYTSEWHPSSTGRKVCWQPAVKMMWQQLDQVVTNIWCQMDIKVLTEIASLVSECNIIFQKQNIS